jgi:hypothetical protein
MKTTKNTTKKQTAATAILGAMATDAKAKASTVVPESAQVTEGAPGAGGSKPKAKAKAKDDKAKFGRFNQPVPCRSCGKLTTWSEANGNCGLDLCQACYDDATLENAHFDGYHTADRDGFAADCKHCVAEAKAAQPDALAALTTADLKQELAKLEAPKAKGRKSKAVKLASPEVVEAYNKAAEGGFEPADVKPSAETLGTAKALFNEIEKLVAGAGSQVVKLPVEALADESAAKAAMVAKGYSAAEADYAIAQAATEAGYDKLADGFIGTKVEGEKTAAEAAQEVTEVKTKKKAVKKAAKAETAKAPKPEPSKELKVRLYGKGEFYFGKLASERIGSFPHIAVTVEGKKITLTPTKSAKDSIPVGACHAAKVLRAAKVLADTGWSKETQDLVAQPVGEAGFVLEVR